MEVKVFVESVPRVVCGVTEETTCQEVVLSLAQALGQTGRYTLRETFKDFERVMMPGERLLETLDKYGEQAREVRLSLHHSGPSTWDEMSRTNVGRYQPCPPLRRKDPGSRLRRGSSSLTLHRQSLPPLSCSGQEAEEQKEDLKRPKRKSLTLIEEAWEWLESLGKGMVYSTASDKESSRRSNKRNLTSLDVFLTVDDDSSGQGSRSKIRGQKGLNSDLDQTSCCMGGQSRAKESKHSKKTPKAPQSDHLSNTSSTRVEDEKSSLRETIVCQLSCLQDLQVQIARIDKQIFELEEKQRAKRAEEEAQQRMVEEELEQIKFWENELMAEEGYEKDLQRQFLEMKAKALECKPKLEEYKRKMQGLDFFPAQIVAHTDSEMVSKAGANTAATTEVSTVSNEGVRRQQSERDGGGNIDRKLQPKEDFNPPHAVVAPSQMRERRPTGPIELREWWTRWSEAQSSQSKTKQKVIHRSELTIYLGSAKV